MLDINARAYTNLVYRFGTEMRRRGRGATVLVGSGVGLTSGPYNGVYAANKAFHIVLGERSGTNIRSASQRTDFEPQLGRFPWLALECLRSRFLRPRLAMVVLRLWSGECGARM